MFIISFDELQAYLATVAAHDEPAVNIISFRVRVDDIRAKTPRFIDEGEKMITCDIFTMYTNELDDISDYPSYIQQQDIEEQIRAYLQDAYGLEIVSFDFTMDTFSEVDY